MKTWVPSDTAKLTGPRTLADKSWVGPVKLLCIIMFDISKIRPKSILGPVKAQKFSQCLFPAFISVIQNATPYLLWTPHTWHLWFPALWWPSESACDSAECLGAAPEPTTPTCNVQGLQQIWAGAKGPGGPFQHKGYLSRHRDSCEKDKMVLKSGMRVSFPKKSWNL